MWVKISGISSGFYNIVLATVTEYIVRSHKTVREP